MRNGKGQAGRFDRNHVLRHCGRLPVPDPVWRMGRQEGTDAHQLRALHRRDRRGAPISRGLECGGGGTAGGSAGHIQQLHRLLHVFGGNSGEVGEVEGHRVHFVVLRPWSHRQHLLVLALSRLAYRFLLLLLAASRRHLRPHVHLCGRYSHVPHPQELLLVCARQNAVHR